MAPPRAWAEKRVAWQLSSNFITETFYSSLILDYCFEEVMLVAKNRITACGVGRENNYEAWWGVSKSFRPELAQSQQEGALPMNETGRWRALRGGPEAVTRRLEAARGGPERARTHLIVVSAVLFEGIYFTARGP